MLTTSQIGVLARAGKGGGPIPDSAFLIAWRADNLDGFNNTTLSPTRPLRIRNTVTIMNIGSGGGNFGNATESNGGMSLFDASAIQIAVPGSSGGGFFDRGIAPLPNGAEPWCVGVRAYIPLQPYTTQILYAGDTYVKLNGLNQNKWSLRGVGDALLAEIVSTSFYDKWITIILGWDGAQSFLEIGEVGGGPPTSVSAASALPVLSPQWGRAGEGDFYSYIGCGAVGTLAQLGTLRTWLGQGV